MAACRGRGRVGRRGLSAGGSYAAWRPVTPRAGCQRPAVGGPDPGPPARHPPDSPPPLLAPPDSPALAALLTPVTPPDSPAESPTPWPSGPPDSPSTPGAPGASGLPAALLARLAPPALLRPVPSPPPDARRRRLPRPARPRRYNPGRPGTPTWTRAGPAPPAETRAPRLAQPGRKHAAGARPRRRHPPRPTPGPRPRPRSPARLPAKNKRPPQTATVSAAGPQPVAPARGPFGPAPGREPSTSAPTRPTPMGRPPDAREPQARRRTLQGERGPTSNYQELRSHVLYPGPLNYRPKRGECPWHQILEPQIFYDQNSKPSLFYLLP